MVSVTAPPTADEELQHVSDTEWNQQQVFIFILLPKSETQLLCILIQNSLESD